MYHVIATGLTIIVLYLLSYFFYRSGIYSLQFHRKLWNSVLAIAFIISALSGIFLALQVTYKWDIPIIKAILKWHVEIGIGLSATGLFHFLWHSSYFIRIFRRQETEDQSPVFDIAGYSSDLPVMLFITGLISSSVQLLLLREIMNITGGYELIAGAFLFSWLTGSSAGAALAPRSSLSDIRKISLYFSVGPVVSLIMMLLFSRLFMKPGETPSFFGSVILTFLVLLPFCLVSGFTFIKLISASGAGKFHPGRSFSIETAGGILAGILVSILSTGLFNTYQTLFLLIILNLAYVIFIFYPPGKIYTLYLKITVLLISVIIILLPPDRRIRQILLRGVKVTETYDTQFGNITKGSYHEETSIYYDQRLLVYNNDASESEEDIHYALLQTRQTANVLLISGPVNSRMNEIKKYPVRNVVYVERDPALIKGQFESNQDLFHILRIENNDALSYIRETSEKFDAVIMLLPPPSTLSLNRYYTKEFFELVREKMTHDAVYSCSPGINTGYFNDESVKLYSSIFNSLKAVFRNVIPIAGNKLYFIASEKELTPSVCQLVKERGIRNVYVGPDYLSDDLLKLKSDEIMSLMNASIRQNKLTLPVASFYYQSFNLSKSLSEKVPIIIVLGALFALALKTLKSSNSIMFFGAFALSGFEILLLLILQLSLGNMYQLTGLIIAGLLAGLAIGAGSEFSILQKSSFTFRVFILVLFYIASAFLADRIISVKGHLPVIALLIFMGFIPAMITGSFFRNLTSLKSTDTELSGIYSADLAGSALGFIIFSGLTVPLFGIRISLLLLSVLVVAGFLWMMTGKK
jgi:spermidine synthase